jgi:hypothetical protein
VSEVEVIITKQEETGEETPILLEEETFKDEEILE